MIGRIKSTVDPIELSDRLPCLPVVSPDVTAVVLTHRRPQLASDVVRALIDIEGIAPERVVVVVNGAGGLDDPELESAVRMLRIPINLGPAGGFRTGLMEAFADPTTRWAYLCEDDIGLFALPSPRLARLRCLVDDPGLSDRPVGAIVAYGRRFVGRGAHTVNTVPPAGALPDLMKVDVASWGATLVGRPVFESGVLPDPTWYFGLEDFDFFCRVRGAGFDVLVDGEAARGVAVQQTSAGRDSALRDRRPIDADESWRAYYHARNSIALARRYGRPSWFVWHVVHSARHVQLAGGWPTRWAIVHGLWDGMRGRMGANPRYTRLVGEFDSETSDGPEDPSSSNG
jgi:hypothetical protein